MIAASLLCFSTNSTQAPTSMNTINTISKWGGYGASFFIIIRAGAGMAGGSWNLPDWLDALIPSSFVLATLSGVVCLTAASIHHFRSKRQSSPSVGGGEMREGAA